MHASNLVPLGDSRKGSLLAFSVTEGQGVIAGDDGNRYTFVGKEWAAVEMPRAGQRVDFVADGKTAIGVYLDVSGGARAGDDLPFVDDPDCPAPYYRSSDEKMIGGVCAGLARKWNVPVAALRIATVLAAFLWIGLIGYIACWVIFPQRRTKVPPGAVLTTKPLKPPPLPSKPPPLHQSNVAATQDGNPAPRPPSDGSGHADKQ